MNHVFRTLVVVAVGLAVIVPVATAEERLCDASVEDCRAPLLELIRNETVGIDVAFWFMEDDRFATALISRWQQGVPVRVIMDSEANVNYPINATMLKKLADAGIPMLEKTTGGICHWKMMLFAGQEVVEFSSANFSPHAFVPLVPYVDYIDEVIYFSDDLDVVNSFKTKYDDVWTSTSGFSNYANISTARTRTYPTFTLAPELNFPPFQNFQSRSVSAYNRETAGIDSIMFRIMDRRHIDGLIAGLQRGARVRLITEPSQYRDSKGSRYWHSWNVDRLYMAGLAAGVETVRHRKHEGDTHEKATVLHSQKMTIFGSSNWTTSSSNSQLEHNYFTKKLWFYEWFRDNFERKWANLAGFEETQPFVPLPPDAPVYQSPVNAAQNQATTVTLKWHGGFWAHIYDVYLGTDPTSMTKVLDNVELGPSATPTQFQSHTVGGLSPSTTYYWQVVSKTAALMSRSGPVWSFRTTGEAPKAGPADTVLYASKAPVVIGRWSVVTDSSAAGGARMSNPNAGAPRAEVTAATDYFEMKFHAEAGVPYHVWVRGKATSNSWQNDSVYVQFSDSVTQSVTPVYQIGTTSAMNVTIEDCSSCGLSNWGWNDNAIGAGVIGPHVYFAATGEHTVRMSVREDGLSIDQIVLSRDVFLSSAPGLTKDDGTILVESDGGLGGDPVPSAPEIVLHTTNAVLAGAWQRIDDPAAASGTATVLPNLARAKVTTPVAAPTDYFELTFTAEANTPYRIWIRGRAEANTKENDSVHVQFSDAVTASGAPMALIGSSTSVEVNLEDCSACGNSGWGWEDNGWGTPTTLGPEIRFPTAGARTLRVQNREDGFYIDQIVLSPKLYLTASPGANKDDNTILPATQDGLPPPLP